MTDSIILLDPCPDFHVACTVRLLLILLPLSRSVRVMRLFADTLVHGL